MTAKQVFESALIELNKREAPSLILEDYNYFINKAILQFINKMYNAYDVNQQKSDDLRVLKSTVVLTPALNPDAAQEFGSLLSNSYEADLPDDYLHILGCVVEYQVKKTFKCYNLGELVHFGAKRLTADMFSQIINNYYLRPTYKNPYYYINNHTTTSVYPTDDSQTDIDYTPIGTEPSPENVVKVDGNRYGNKSKVQMEIRYGKDNAVFELKKIYIDYLKAPKFIRLSQEEIDKVEDTSQVLEYPDYVIQEIVNELVKLLMENGSDPRLQTHIPINQTIAQPQAEQPQKR